MWADKWLVTMNPVKSRNVLFSLKRNKQVHPSLFLNSNVVKDAESHTHLGLPLQSSMSWRNHIVHKGGSRGGSLGARAPPWVTKRKKKRFS